MKNKKYLPYYDKDKECYYSRAILIAYYSIGLCVEFWRPEPANYLYRYLAQRLIDVPDSNWSKRQWATLNTDNVAEATLFINDEDRWYISDLDNDTVISDKHPNEWVKHLEEDRNT